MFYLRCFCCWRILGSKTYCVVFLCCCLPLVYPMLPVSLDLFYFVFFLLCTLCCQFLWICFILLSSSCVPYVASFSGFVLFCCLRLVYPMLPVSLDCFCFVVFVLCTLCCQFLWICFILLSSSCVPYVASFSGLFLLCCLRLVYPTLPVSLDLFYFVVFLLCTLCCQFLWICFILLSSSCVPYVASFSGLFLLCCLCLVYPMLPVSLDLFCFVVFVLCTLCCQFFWICFVLLSSTCVPYVASFSGFVLFCCLRLVYPMLPVSLDLFCFVVFVLCTLCCQFL